MMSKVQEELQRLYEANGELTAEGVVKEAKKKRSPLHGQFEWDDTKAGHKYRLVQARTLIRSVKIEVNGERQKLIHVPVEVGTREGRYVAPDVLIEHEDEYELAMEAAQKDLDAAIRRVAELRRLRPDESDRFSTASRSIEAAKLALAS